MDGEEASTKQSIGAKDEQLIGNKHVK